MEGLLRVSPLLPLLFVLAPPVHAMGTLVREKLHLDVARGVATGSFRIDGYRRPDQLPNNTRPSYLNVTAANGQSMWVAEERVTGCIPDSSSSDVVSALNAVVNNFTVPITRKIPVTFSSSSVRLQVSVCGSDESTYAWVYEYHEEKPPEGVFSCRLELPPVIDLGTLTAEVTVDVGASIICVETGEGTATVKLASANSQNPTSGLTISTTVPTGGVKVRGGERTPVEIAVTAKVAAPVAGRYTASFVYVLNLL